MTISNEELKQLLDETNQSHLYKDTDLFNRPDDDVLLNQVRHLSFSILSIYFHPIFIHIYYLPSFSLIIFIYF